MDMTLEVLEKDDKLTDVMIVRVPSIYGAKGAPLPRRMSRLVRSATSSLKAVFADVVRGGGHLYISDMFRSAADQQRAHEDWKTGRKSAYSPPAGGSVHEAARAIDIDAFDTGIGHKRVREILNAHGWVCIVESLTAAECWHYEFREQWEAYRRQHGYAAMAAAMIEAIGNVSGRRITRWATEDVKWVQESLNLLLGISLPTDGVYDEGTRSAVMLFQQQQSLQVDGVAGPITRQRIADLLAALHPEAVNH